MKCRRRIALSVAAGVAAAVIAFLAVTGVRQEAVRKEREILERYGGELTSVCVASRNIEPGEEVDEGNTIMTEWVPSLLPDGVLTSLSDVAGQTATARIPARAPLSEIYFERGDGSIEVPRGMVAVSVASDPEHAVGGSLKKGEKVDVYAQGDSLADKLTSAEIIDSNVLSSGGGDVQWVTLGVRPSAVRELLAATSRGMVVLVAPGGDASDQDEG